MEQEKCGCIVTQGPFKGQSCAMKRGHKTPGHRGVGKLTLDAERAVRRLATNPEARKTRRCSRTSLHGKSGSLYQHSRKRAEKDGLPFTITREWVEAELAKALADGCPYLGIPIALDTKGWSPNGPSVDRIVPELGYTPENCIIVSLVANRAKNNASLQMMERVLGVAKQRGLYRSSSRHS